MSHDTIDQAFLTSLDIPRAALDLQRDAIVWRWELSGEAFGASAPNEDPDGDGQRLRLDLRFPGQRHDPATGLHENHHRDYDPNTGRYLQSDPIGVEGGINTYAYVEGNPLRFIDPYGLCPCGNPWDVINSARSDERDWSHGADRSDINSGFGKGSYKCNLFADTHYEESGYNLPNIGGNLISQIFERYPPGANNLSDRNYIVPGWPVISGPHKAGDLIAYDGHVGIVSGEQKVISASPSGVVENDWGFRDGQNPVFRRCTCP